MAAVGYPERGAARYALLVLTLLGFVLTTDITLTALLIEPMKRDLRLSDMDLALLQGTAYGLALGLGSPWMGRMNDRFPRRALIAVGLCAWVCAFVTIGLATSVPVLVVARVVLGLVAALVVPATFSMVSDIYPAAQRSVATSLLVVGQALGQGFGMLAGGLAFDALTVAERSGGGTPFGLAPWRELYLVAALGGLVLLALLVSLREPGRQEVGETPSDLRRALGELWAFRGFMVPLVLALLFAQVTIQAAAVWASPLLIRRGLTPGEFAGWMSAVLFVGGILGALAGGQLAELGRRRHGRSGVLVPGALLALVIAPASLFVIAPSLPLFGALLALDIFAGAVVATVGVIAMTLVIPNDIRGLALGLSTLVSAVFGTAGAPAVIAYLSAWLGGESFLAWAFVGICVPSAMLAALSMLVATRGGSAVAIPAIVPVDA